MLFKPHKSTHLCPSEVCLNLFIELLNERQKSFGSKVSQMIVMMFKSKITF